MRKLRIMSVVGARPNFMKIAPFARALDGYASGITHCLVHTGQHYDREMSESFFAALNIPEPDVNLGVGSGTHAEQVGQTMIAFEKTVRDWKPDWVVVVGDVNATCACAITAKKEHVGLAHIEAGLRSFDLTMPEEINRIVADRLSDLLFTHCAIADRNLMAEGIPENKIKRVGNIMIDTLEQNRSMALALDPREIISGNLLEGGIVRDITGIENRYAALTLHRPPNVDRRDALESLVNLFADELSAEIPLIWTVHPRTKKQLEAFGLLRKALSAPGIYLVGPLGYRELLRLNLGASVVLTDSGGLQEECCVLGTPCVTMRENTERPITLQEEGGVSVLTGSDVGKIRNAFHEMLRQPRREARPPLWDGHTAERIAEIFAGIAR